MSDALGDRIRTAWQRPAVRIPVIYAVVGALWILLSDRLLGVFIHDPDLVTLISILKGWGYVIFTAWLLSVLIRRDFTALRRSEQALEKSERRFRQAIDNAPYAIMILDPDLRVRYANAEEARLTGLDQDQIVGRIIEELFPPEVTGKFLPALLSAVETKTSKTIETSLEMPSGMVILIINFVPVLDEDGNIYQILGIASDVTERRLAEQHRRELAQQQQEFYRRTILAATEGKLMITDRQEIERVAGPPIAAWDIKTGNDLARIRTDVERLAGEAGMEPNRIFDFVLATGEATTNAYKHAGGGTASLHRINDCLMIVVSDQGKGMEALALPEVALKRGYSTAQSLGMGYKAILSVADRVYLATGPTGTTVGIQMGLHAPESAFAALGLPDTWALQT